MRFFKVKQTHKPQVSSDALAAGGKCLFALALFALSFSSVSLPAWAQTKSTSRKLPAAERIVGDYLKAIGGKKRLTSIADATYEWSLKLQEQTMGVATTHVKAPVSVRTTMTFGNGVIEAAANPSSAWERGLDGTVRTLTGAEAGAAKLQAILDASRLVDYKRLNVMARTAALDESAAEAAYVVEFSMRNGSRLRYSFSVKRKLLLTISDEARKTATILSDYRAENDVLEPHRKEVSTGGSGSLTFLLQRVKYNSGLGAGTFDPPRAAEMLDITSLMREVLRNQDALEDRTAEYSFKEKQTTREINDRGEVRKETVKVFEVFPIANRDPVYKLISEGGVPLSAERAAKEDRRVQDEMEKAEKEREQLKQKREREKAERATKRARRNAEDEDPAISQFLRVCEFVSPRRERFRDRDAIVFDFRPRADFHPTNRAESLISKLVGVVWIDPADHQVMRLEARLAEGFKIGGGLVVSLRPGAAFVIEQTRMAEGVWLPRFAQINLSVRVLLFGGGDINQTFEWSDYQHYKGDVESYKLEAPPVVTPVKPKP